MNVVVLDLHFTNCNICGKEFPLKSGGHALPMYEGKPDYRSKIYFPVCKKCFDEIEEMKGRNMDQF